MFILQEKVNGKFRNVSGKFQYGAVHHARRRAEKDYGGKLKWEITGLSKTYAYGKDNKGKIFYQLLYYRSDPKMKRKKNADTEAYELGLYADNLGPSSKGLENDVYEIRQKFLTAIKKGRPKKELVNLTKHAAHRAARAYSKAFGSGAHAWQEIFSDSDLNKAAKYLYDSWEEESDVKRNPKRKKTMRKKKRSAKQLANDRRLGRMAKARAKAKRGGRRKKTVRKKNTHRKIARKKNVHATRRKKVRRTSAGRWYQIFKCKGSSVHFLALTTLGKLRWTLTRGDTIRWSSKSEATKIAKRLARGRTLSGFHVGVAASSDSASTIAAFCGGK